jgi:hypothetical protein
MNFAAPQRLPIHRNPDNVYVENVSGHVYVDVAMRAHEGAYDEFLGSTVSTTGGTNRPLTMAALASVKGS